MEKYIHGEEHTWKSMYMENKILGKIHRYIYLFVHDHAYSYVHRHIAYVFTDCLRWLQCYQNCFGCLPKCPLMCLMSSCT
jgi:hypothetical protein